MTDKVEELTSEVKALSTSTAAPDDDELEAQAEMQLKLRPNNLDQGGHLIVEQSADLSSPIASASSFEELGLPVNLIAQAQSGTGKTATFALCMLQKINLSLKCPQVTTSFRVTVQCICLAPTRELARQIEEEIRILGQFTTATIQLVVRDKESMILFNSRVLVPSKIDSHIVVGTPGKLLDAVQRNHLNMSKISVFVLDEADMMISANMGEQSAKLRKLSPKSQILLFSATYSKEVLDLTSRIVPKPFVRLTLQRKQLTLEIIKQYYVQTKDEKEKYSILASLIGYLPSGQMIIFTQTRETAIDLQKQMVKDGHPVGLLHGGKEMTSAERDKIMDSFRNGVTKVLITTNVLARGIDVLQVMMVVNFDIPVDGVGSLDKETYLHRIGRSGRFGKKGVAINLVHDLKSVGMIKSLSTFFNREIVKLSPDEFPALRDTMKQFYKDNEEIIANYHKTEDENNTVEVKKLSE